MGVGATLAVAQSQSSQSWSSNRHRFLQSTWAISIRVFAMGDIESGDHKKWAISNRVFAMSDPESGDHEGRPYAGDFNSMTAICENNTKRMTTDKFSNSALLFLRKPVETLFISRSPDSSHPRRLPIFGQWLFAGQE